jgi:hypothetical protein
MPPETLMTRRMGPCFRRDDSLRVFAVQLSNNLFRHCEPTGAHSRDPLARNDGEIRVRDLAAPARASLALKVVPSEQRGAGNAGCPLHPQPRVRN